MYTSAIIRYLELHPMRAWAISGILLGVAFWHPWLWWVALVGVWMFWTTLTKATSWRQVVIGSLIAGWLQFALVLWWGWSLYPLTFFTVPAAPSLLLIAITVAMGWLPLGCARLMTAVALYRYRKWRWSPLLLPFFWLAGDMVAASLGAVVNVGPGTSTFAPVFSFGWLGYLSAEHALLLPAASLVGVYGLTVLYVAIVALIILLPTKYQWRRRGLIGVSIFIVLGSAVPAVPRQHEPAPIVVALETNYLQTTGLTGEELQLQIDSLMRAVTSAITSGADVVVVPETVNISRAFASSSDALDYFANLGTKPVTVIDNSRVTTPDGNGYLRARYYDTGAMQVYELDKQYLVPNGEYVAYWLSTLLKLIDPELADRYTDAVDYRPGPLARQTSLPNDIPRVLFCFESINPLGVRQLANTGGPSYVVHPVSYGWFNEPHILWHQLDQMLQVNARFGGVTVYRAANLHTSARY